jgi:hypothetical protein
VVTLDITAHFSQPGSYDQAMRGMAKDMFAELWKVHGKQFEIEAKEEIGRSLKEIETLKSDQKLMGDSADAVSHYDQRIAEEYIQINQLNEALNYRQDGTEAGAEFASQLDDVK